MIGTYFTWIVTVMPFSPILPPSPVSGDVEAVPDLVQRVSSNTPDKYFKLSFCNCTKCFVDLFKHKTVSFSGVQICFSSDVGVYKVRTINHAKLM